MAGTIDNDIQVIRQGIYGKDVREAIADGLEKVEAHATGPYVQYTTQELTDAQKSKARTNIGAKPTQTAVSNPTASGNATTFVDSITQNANGVISPTRKTIPNASSSAAGLMTAADKTKLDNVDSSFKPKQTAVSNPTASGNATTFVDSITQNANGVISPTRKTIPNASSSAAGLMTAADKTKLDDIANNALQFRKTLTNEDDFNDIAFSGTYYFRKSSLPANSPPITGSSGRVFIIKSDTENAHSYEWQMVVDDGDVYYRSCDVDGTIWSNWHSTKYALQFKKTLSSSDDLNDIAVSGVYYFRNTSLPSHTPPITGPAGRVLIIKSDTENSHSCEWQMLVDGGDVYYRSCDVAGTTWSDWHSTQEDIFKFRGTLVHDDDLDSVKKNGLYFYSSDDKPENAPINIPSRPIVFKSTTDENVSAQFQMLVSDGTLFYRSYNSRGPVDKNCFSDWKSVGLGSPVYQNETLPYNAVLYHQKWDYLLNDKFLRRINLGNVDNDSSLPIYAYEFSPQRFYVGLTPSGDGSTPVNFNWENALYERPKALIIGGVHGNEKCTPMDIFAIAKRLLSRDYNDIACKFDWYFIPLVNPWGYSHARLDSNGDILWDNSGVTASVVACTEEINAGIRNNSHGQNINRDWSDVVYTSGGVQYGFQTPELQLIKDYVLSIKPDLFIDAHQNHTDKAGSTNPVCCHSGAAIDEDNDDSTYISTMRKIYRYIDVANADTDKIMLRYSNSVNNHYQACRIWPTIRASTSEHYFSGITALNGSTVIGNTQHQAIATPYSLCSETSEICHTYSGTSDWYNPIACTFSCTYLWNLIKQMSLLF